jgi:hypothetical protein
MPEQVRHDDRQDPHFHDTGLIVAERLDRVHSGGFAGGVETENGLMIYGPILTRTSRKKVISLGLKPKDFYLLPNPAYWCFDLCILPKKRICLFRL